jgi:hypothetical protein
VLGQINTIPLPHNDLPDSVTSSVKLFADDCLLYRTIKTAKDHQKLQADLEQLEIWANDWDMRFNAKNAIYYPSTKNRINSTLLIITSFKKFKTTHT